MSQTSLRAAAWDIDGTLVDSEPLHHRALLAASATFGVDLSNLPDMAFRGIHMHDVWAALRPRLPKALRHDTWLAAINRYYIDHCQTLRALPEAVETIRALHQAGIAQICVSNSNRAIVDANIDALGIGSYLRFAISLDDVGEGKPSPLPYRAAVARLNLSPAQVVAIEDSLTGFQSAKAAGLRTVLVAGADPLPWAGDGPDFTTSTLGFVRTLF